MTMKKCDTRGMAVQVRGKRGKIEAVGQAHSQ